MIRYLFLFFCAVLFFTSCEKDINIKLHPTTTDLVVDASIETENYPVVILSTSLDYFSKIDPHVLAEHFVHHANVTMTNGIITATLHEDSIRNDSSGLAIYFYTFLPSDTLKFKGAEKTRYDLTIVAGSKTYTAFTTIPALDKLIDSLWWKPVNNPSNDPEDSSFVNVVGRITDPPGLGNYTRYYTSVNGQPFYPGLNSVFDDQITDGTTYDITIPQGVNRNASIDAKTYSFFNKGDFAVIKFSNIDKATYDFWRTMEYNYSSVGNPFSTPTEVLSNVSNGALGYFGGYANQLKTLLIPY